MRELVRGLVLGVLALAVLGAIAGRAGWVELDVPRAAGQGPWMVSRATGFTAFVALALDVIVGLLVSTRLADRWLARGRAIELHGWLSPLALALVIGHVAALLADGYLRFDLLDVVVPFAAPYRAFAVGLGVVALYVAVVVHVSFGLRRRLGARAWRRLHYLSFVAFVAAAGHAMLAGTDAARSWAIVLAAGPLAIVTGLVMVRVIGSRGSVRRRGHPGLHQERPS